MGKLTDIQIRHWLKAGQPVAKAQGDVPGLTFTLSAKGTAAWILRYRIGGKARELTIGRYPEYGIAQAKAAALEARAKIQAGADVAREKRLEHINRAGSMSFAELARDYLAKKLPGLSDSTRTYRTRHIENLIIPRMGAIQANEVNGADIVALLETIGSKHSHIVARHVLIAFNDVFKHGMAKRVITQNPCFGINVNAICGPAPATKPRLMLTEAELRQLLPNLHRLSESNGLALRIMLATCVRINELFKAKWCDVDLERGEWIVPKSKKSDQPFVIPLAPVVVDWLRRLQVLACGSPLCPAIPRPERHPQQQRFCRNPGEIPRRPGWRPPFLTPRSAIYRPLAPGRAGRARADCRTLLESHSRRLGCGLRPARLPDRAAQSLGAMGRLPDRLRGWPRVAANRR
jgi:integrase